MEFYRIRELNICGRTVQLGKGSRLKSGTEVVGEKDVMLIGHSSIQSPSTIITKAREGLTVVAENGKSPVLLAVSLIGNWWRENVYTPEQVNGMGSIRLRSRIPFVNQVVTAA
jgi:hypothetical protein